MNETLQHHSLKSAKATRFVFQFFFGLFCLTFATTLTAQEIGQQSFIIQTDDTEAGILKHVCESLNLEDSQVKLKKIFEDDVYKLTIQNTEKASHISLDHVARVKGIHACQNDTPVEWRREPNDPDFSIQEGLQLIDIERAWDFTTGGTTPSGRQIVIAIMDEGYDVTHEDLIPNLWTNPGEIPNNGFDDDNNGYIDDHLGLNVATDNDQHVVRSHGTSVSGIIGARGNNGIGISGVAWDAQLLLVSGVRSSSGIIEANNYIRDQRRLYNESNGAEGAFIVASNYSGGISNAFESDEPLVCQSYLSLGQEGVLTIGAASNRDEDLDVVGDIPAHCSSEHVIIVTNTAIETDELFSIASVGPSTVDLGAPGQGTFTTTPNSQFDIFGGASASAPHVAGTVALIHGVACEEFETMIDDNPSDAALEMKNFILSNVDSRRSLDGLTVSGGRLNAFASLTGLREFCGSTNTETLDFLFQNPVEDLRNIDIELDTPFLLDHEIFIHSASGQLVYFERFTPPLFGQLSLRLSDQQYAFGVYFMTISNSEVSETKSFLYLPQ